MNVVDSSAWMEYFTDGPNAAFFAPAIEDVARLAVPSLALLEVFGKTLRSQGEGMALRLAAQMKQGQVYGLNDDLALRAAKVQHELSLSTADSIVLATAWSLGAKLWTQSEHLRDLPSVCYRPRAAPAGEKRGG